MVYRFPAVIAFRIQLGARLVAGIDPGMELAIPIPFSYLVVPPFLRIFS